MNDIIIEILKYIPEKFQYFRLLNKSIKNKIDSLLMKYQDDFNYYDICNNKYILSNELINHNIAFHSEQDLNSYIHILLKLDKKKYKIYYLTNKSQKKNFFKKFINNVSNIKKNILIIKNISLNNKNIFMIRSKLSNYKIFYNIDSIEEKFSSLHTIQINIMFNLNILNYKLLYVHFLSVIKKHNNYIVDDNLACFLKNYIDKFSHTNNKKLIISKNNDKINVFYIN